jgi:Amt family ammonium transporter
MLSAYALAAGFVLYSATKAALGIRLTDDQQRRGADLSIHSIGANPDEF